MAPSESLPEFRQLFQKSRSIVVLTGAGISAESGIPTFRGPGAFWRGFPVEQLAMNSLFQSDPSLVWELYHFRREVSVSKSPNRGHLALAEAERKFQLQGSDKTFRIITQNIDELHTKAGSGSVVELHGSLFKTECVQCGDVAPNYDSPICPALEGKGEPEVGREPAQIAPEELPRCRKCKGLLRPYIIWFDEDPTEENMELTYKWLNECDLLLVIGTSSIVEPANEFGPLVQKRGVPVAEFNLERTAITDQCQFHIRGPCGTTLPEALLQDDLEH